MPVTCGLFHLTDARAGEVPQSLLPQSGWQSAANFSKPSCASSPLPLFITSYWSSLPWFLFLLWNALKFSCVFLVSSALSVKDTFSYLDYSESYLEVAESVHLKHPIDLTLGWQDEPITVSSEIHFTFSSPRVPLTMVWCCPSKFMACFPRLLLNSIWSRSPDYPSPSSYVPLLPKLYVFLPSFLNCSYKEITIYTWN